MVCLVFEEHLEFLVPRGLWVTRVVVGPLVCRALKEIREHRVHQQEGQSTLAGGGPTVPVTSKLNLSILEELEEVIPNNMVGQLTSSAYLMILSTLHMAVEQIIMHLEELNIEQPLVSHFVVMSVTTCHVLCAMPPPETQY